MRCYRDTSVNERCEAAPMPESRVKNQDVNMVELRTFTLIVGYVNKTCVNKKNAYYDEFKSNQK